jgi:hypothetical protein
LGLLGKQKTHGLNEKGRDHCVSRRLYSRSPLTLQKHQKRAAALTRLLAADRNVVQLKEIALRFDREARAPSPGDNREESRATMR